MRSLLSALAALLLGCSGVDVEADPKSHVGGFLGTARSDSTPSPIEVPRTDDSPPDLTVTVVDLSAGDRTPIVIEADTPFPEEFTLNATSRFLIYAEAFDAGGVESVTLALAITKRCVNPTTGSPCVRNGIVTFRTEQFPGGDRVASPSLSVSDLIDGSRVSRCESDWPEFCEYQVYYSASARNFAGGSRRSKIAAYFGMKSTTSACQTSE
jgi:hypothetical protein